MLQYFTHKQLNLPVSHDNTAKYTAEKKLTRMRHDAVRNAEWRKTRDFSFMSDANEVTRQHLSQNSASQLIWNEGDRTMEGPPGQETNSWDHRICDQGRNPLSWHLEPPTALKTITAGLLWYITYNTEANSIITCAGHLQTWHIKIQWWKRPALRGWLQQSKKYASLHVVLKSIAERDKNKHTAKRVKRTNTKLWTLFPALANFSEKTNTCTLTSLGSNHYKKVKCIRTVGWADTIAW